MERSLHLTCWEGPASRRRLRAGLALFLGASLLGWAQTTVYWDGNGSTSGAGVTPTGNWNTAGATNWNANAAGTGAVANWTAGNHAVFSAGTDATGTYTVTLGGNMSVGNLTFEEGTATVTGNTLTLTGAGGSTIDVASGLTAQIDSLLAGTVALNKTGSGTLVLGGTTFNSHTGNVAINAGVLEIAKTAFVGGIDNAAATTVAAGATLRFNGGAAYTQETIGSLSGAGTVTNVSATALSLIISGGASTTFSGTLTDAGGALSLVKNTGTGTLTLSGANSYDGTTTISNGAINIQHATALGTTAGGTTVASGAALQLQGNIAVGAEALSLAGTGIGNTGALRNISGTNSYAGNLTLTAATEIQSDAGVLNLSGNVTGATFSLTVDGAGDTNLTGTISTTSGRLTKNGTGTLTLSGTNAYTGLTDLNAGTLSVNTLTDRGIASALGAPTTVANGTIAIGNGATGATLQYTGAGNSTNRVIDLAGTTGGATLDASGTGALVFTSALTATGAGSKTLTLTGTNTDANTIQGAIVNNSGTNLTSVVKDGTGTWVLDAANSYTGSTTLNNGTLRISADNRLGTAPGAATANKLVFNGGTLETTATFTLNANRGVTVNAGGGTFDVNAGTTLTYNGILAGAGTLTKADTGTLVLGGATTNTHTGDIDVDAGILEIAKTTANAAIGDAATVTIAAGATVNFNGTANETIGALAGDGTFNQLGGSVLTLANDSVFDGTYNLGGGTLRLSDISLSLGTLNITGNSFLDFAGAASTLSVDSFNIAAGVTLTIQNWANATDFFFAQNWTGAAFNVTGSAPMNQITFTGFAPSDTKWQGYDSQITPVPEPSTYGAGLLGLGGALLAWRRRRRARP